MESADSTGSHAADGDAERGRFAAFVTDDATERMVRQCIADFAIPYASVQRGDITTAIKRLSLARSPRALLVDLTDVSSALARVHELAEVCEPGVAVLTIGDRNDVALYRNLLDTGVSDYLVKPPSRSLLERAIGDVLGLATGEQRGASGTVVGILGTRGGVGASTLATNLAWDLTARKRHRSILIDLDLHHGSCDLMLGVKPTDGLHEALLHPERVDGLFLQRASITCDGGLMLLASHDKINAPGNIDPNALPVLIASLRSEFDFIVVDAPVGHEALVAQVLELARTRVFVVDQTMQALRDMIDLRQSIAATHDGKRDLVVLNRFGEPGRDALALKDIEGVIGMPVDAVVPCDARSALAAANHGVPLVKSRGPVGRAVMALTDDLCGEPAVAAAQRPWWRFFGH